MYTLTSRQLGAAPANKVIDEIRRERAVPKDVMEEARARRDAVREMAATHDTARASFNSGSIAHGTTNSPISDADCGVVLDRRSYPQYGPDYAGDSLPPEPLMKSFEVWILPRLRSDYPNVTCEIHTRALLFEFQEPFTDDRSDVVDPSVDLVIGLNRRDAPGLWIPNRDRNGWEPSDPQRHTEMFVRTEEKLRVHRARVIRLVKVAVKHDGERKVMHSFNVEALALEYVTEVQSIGVALRDFLSAASADIAEALTDDPAGVSGPIQLPDDITQQRASERLAEMARTVQAALEAHTERDARERLATIFGPEVTAICDRIKQGQHHGAGPAGRRLGRRRRRAARHLPSPEVDGLLWRVVDAHLVPTPGSTTCSADRASSRRPGICTRT